MIKTSICMQLESSVKSCKGTEDMFSRTQVYANSTVHTHFLIIRQ